MEFESYIIFLFLAFIMLDLVVLPYAVSKNLATTNKYYNFHKSYGVKRTTILKILFGLITIFCLINPAANVHKAYFSLFIYFAYLVWCFLVLFSATPEKREIAENEHYNKLDCIAGFLAYPFEHLNSKKKFYPVESLRIKWSWKAFLIPEYWYFSQELLGAGYISWALILAYLFIGLSIGQKVFILIILLRIISGAYGNQLYHFVNGKFP